MKVLHLAANEERLERCCEIYLGGGSKSQGSRPVRGRLQKDVREGMDTGRGLLCLCVRKSGCASRREGVAGEAGRKGDVRCLHVAGG
jgi:hypothetical protein